MNFKKTRSREEIEKAFEDTFENKMQKRLQLEILLDCRDLLQKYLLKK